MDNKDASNEALSKPQILREFEFYGGCIRVKISVKNTSNLAILDAALELESDERILHFDRCEPEYPEKKGKIQLGNINPNSDRTIAFYLDPLICAKEGTDVNCRISFKDALGRPDSVQMEPLKIKVVCPIFRTEQDINIGRLKELISELQFYDSKVYTIPKKVEVSELLRICRDVVLLHDVRHIKTFKTTDEETYEAWYYGKTKVTKKDLVIKCCIRRYTESIEVFASGNDPGDITGLLAEIGRNLAKEFERLGKVQHVFNIHIKDSIIQRSNLLSFCDFDGTCGGNVVIEDSVVQRSSIASWNEVPQKEREEERHDEERLRRQRGEQERIARDKEELIAHKEPERTLWKGFFAVALMLGVLLLGYLALAPSSTNMPETSKSTPAPIPKVAPTTPIPTPAPTPVTTPKMFSITYRVYMDSDRGFYLVRAVNGTTYIPMPSDFNRLNFTISVGDKLEWINDDSYDFPITIISNEGLWQERGANYLRWQYAHFEYTFNKTGTYTFSIKEYPRIQHQKIIVDH